MEGASLRTDFRPSNIPTLNGAGTPRAPLEDVATLSRRCDRDLTGLRQSPPEIRGSPQAAARCRPQAQAL